MAIHLYLDEELTQQISEGDFSNPDADNYNGTDGEIKDRQIFVPMNRPHSPGRLMTYRPT